jgi:hypothetical protein
MGALKNSLNKKIYCKFRQLIKRGTGGLMIAIALHQNALTLKVEIEQTICSK